MIWTKIAKLEVWWHPPMMPSATIPTTLRLSRHRPHGEGFSSRHSWWLLMDSFAQWPYTVSGSRTGAVAVLVPVVKRETAEQARAPIHMYDARGGVGGDGKPFLEIQGAYREPWAGVKIPSVCLVHTSLSLPVRKLFTRQSRPICMLYWKHKNA